MPTVKYQPDQVRTQVAGTTQAQTTPNGGQQLAQGINAMGQLATEINRQKTVAETQQAATMFEREKNKVFFDPDNGYFNTSGRSAVDQAEATTKRLEELKKEFGSTLSPRALQEFNRVADGYITRGNADIMRHSATNLKAWNVSNAKAEVENSLESGSLYWNNLKQLDLELDKGVQAVIDSAGLQGVSGTAKNEMIQSYRSAFSMNVIDAAVSSSVADGEKALELWGKGLEGPDRVKVDQLLEKRREVEDTKDKANEAVTRANSLVMDFGDRLDARGAMIEEINKIGDPELQKLVKAEATYQLNQKLVADDERRANTVIMGEEFIYAKGNSVEQFKATYPDEWNDLRPAQRAMLQKTAPVQTDYVVWQELKLMSPDKLANIKPSEYFGVLDPSKRDALLNLVSDARAGVTTGRTSAASTSATVEQIFGAKSDWKTKDVAKVNAFYRVLDSEVLMLEKQKGAPLSDKEYDDVLNRFTRKAVQEKSYWFDSEISLEEFAPEDLDFASSVLNSMGESVTAESVLEFQNNMKLVNDRFIERVGRKPTQDELATAYRNAR